MDTVVKFNNAKTNVGGNYNPNTGLFIAPKPGLYEFSVNFVKHEANDQFMALKLMKNNEVIARGHSASVPLTAGSMRAIVNLSKGDNVFVSHSNHVATVHGNDYSMFSGRLL